MGLRFWMAIALGMTVASLVVHADETAPQPKGGSCNASLVPSLRDDLESWVPEHLLHAIAEKADVGKSGHSARDLVDKIRRFGHGLSPSYLENLAGENPIHFKRKSPKEGIDDPIEKWTEANAQKEDEALPTYFTRMAVALALAKQGAETPNGFTQTQQWAKEIVERLEENGSIDRLFFELVANHPEEWANMRANVCGLPAPVQVNASTEVSPNTLPVPADPNVVAWLAALHSKLDEVRSSASSISFSMYVVLYFAALASMSQCSAH